MEGGKKGIKEMEVSGGQTKRKSERKNHLPAALGWDPTIAVSIPSTPLTPSCFCSWETGANPGDRDTGKDTGLHAANQQAAL